MPCAAAGWRDPRGSVLKPSCHSHCTARAPASAPRLRRKVSGRMAAQPTAVMVTFRLVHQRCPKACCSSGVKLSPAGSDEEPGASAAKAAREASSAKQAQRRAAL